MKIDISIIYIKIIIMETIKTNFEKIKELINEYDELQKFIKELDVNSNSIAVMHSNWDGPGINYSTYSERIKRLIISASKNRMTEISKHFN